MGAWDAPDFLVNENRWGYMEKLRKCFALACSIVIERCSLSKRRVHKR
jgi:hypothetical protein